MSENTVAEKFANLASEMMSGGARALGAGLTDVSISDHTQANTLATLAVYNELRALRDDLEKRGPVVTQSIHVSDDHDKGVVEKVAEKHLQKAMDRPFIEGVEWPLGFCAVVKVGGVILIRRNPNEDHWEWESPDDGEIHSDEGVYQMLTGEDARILWEGERDGD